MQTRHLPTLILALLGVGCSPTPVALLAAQPLQAAANNGASLKALNPNLPKGDRERPAVLLSYLPIDDQLDAHIPYYVNALERTTSDRIYNVALSDGARTDDTYAIRVTADQSPEILSQTAPPAPGVTELTTNHPTILANTVAWAYSSYPGRFKAFSYLGHGFGMFGIGTDLNAGSGPNHGKYQQYSMMSTKAFGQAIKTGLKGRKLDLIHLHACLMGNLEAAYDLRGVATVLVASQDMIGAHQEGTEKPTEILNTAIQEPNADARAVGREIVIKLEARRNPYGYQTAAAIDLDRITAVKAAVNDLGTTLLTAMPTRAKAIRSAYGAVPKLKINPSNSPQRDLWTFCNQLNGKVADPNVQRAALATKQALRQALLHQRDGQGDAANGLTVHMPDIGFQPWADYAQTSFAQDTNWDDFLMVVCKP